MTGRVTLRAWLAKGPFTLAMSSGFFSFFAHGGVLTALSEESLLPDAVSGSSAGALTAGLWAAGLEPGEIRRLFFSLRKQDFWDPAPGPGLLRGRLFRRLIRGAVPVQTVERCRRSLAISTFDLTRLRTRVLSSGDLARALYASCAVPFMFRPLWHLGGLLVDGGLRDRPGLRGVPEGQRVFYHHIMTRNSRSHRRDDIPRFSGRQDLVALAIPRLPRPGPEALELGAAAWSAAREATLRALDSALAPAASSTPAVVSDAVGGSRE